MEPEFLSLPVKRCKKNPPVLKEFPSGPKLWFDVLPQEILTRIVAALTLQSGGIPPRQIAELSPFFLRAMTELRKSRYENNVRQDDNDSWAVAFADSGTTRHLILCLQDWPYLSRAVRISAIRILSSPLLQTAVIPDMFILIKHALQSRTLRELEVQFHMKNYPKNDGLPAFLRIGSMSLRKLDIVCNQGLQHYNKSRECIFQRMQRLQDEAGLTLARSCPHLIEFGSFRKCSSHCSRGSKFSPFWRIWETLPNIRTATLQPYYFRGSSIEPRVLDRLKALESVRIMNMLEHAALLGPVVTSISDRFQRSGDDPSIRALSKCVGLSDLRLKLIFGDGDLRALNHAVHFMPVLKYLSLRWTCDTDITGSLRCRYIKTARDGNVSTCVAVFPEFHEQTVESVMQLVRQTPVLEGLELLDVRIPTEGVVDVLRHLGNRLKHFGVSLSGQADSSFERLQILIATICKYNCRLQSVSSGLRGTAANAFSLQNVKRVHLSEVNVGLLEERKGKLDEMLQSVSRCVPFLNPSSLKSWLDDVSWIEVQYSAVW